VVVVDDGHDGEEFGFAAGFESEAVLASEGEDFFYDVALLVDLDGVYTAVFAVKIVVGDGFGERLGDFADAVPEDVGEPNEDWQTDVTFAEFVDEFFEVYGVVGALGRVHGDVAGGVDREVSLSPVTDAVDFG